MSGPSHQIQSVAVMHDFAAAIAARLPGGSIVGLSGPLGAGKTEFVRGVCIAAKIPSAEVSSPSYVLEQLYSCADSALAFRQLSHWDLYRLRDSAELEELLERAQPDTVVFVEWPERIAALPGHLSLLIEFAHGAGEERLLTVEIYDKALKDLLVGL